MRGDQRQHDRRVAIGVEVRPIQRDDNRGLRRGDVRHPVGEQRPDVEGGIAQEPVNLFDRMLGLQPARRRQANPDRMNGERDSMHHAHDGVRDRVHLPATAARVRGEPRKA